MENEEKTVINSDGKTEERELIKNEILFLLDNKKISFHTGARIIRKYQETKAL